MKQIKENHITICECILCLELFVYFVEIMDKAQWVKVITPTMHQYSPPYIHLIYTCFTG